jgi:hypothetical protein
LASSPRRIEVVKGEDMKAKKLDFPDASSATATIFAMIDILRESVRAKDKEAIHQILGMLAQATAGVTRLLKIRHAQMGRHSLGASFPPEHWKDMGPAQILHEVAEHVAIEEALMELKRERFPGARSADLKKLSAQVGKMRRKLQQFVRSSRAWIKGRWPEAWTEKEESEYGRFFP